MVNDDDHSRRRMVRIIRRGTLAALVSIAVAVVAAGCTSPSSAGDSVAVSDLSLVETKSPVQLLRNDAIDRIDPQFVSEIRATNDESEACLTEAGNPGGLVRRWVSSAEISLADDADVDYVTERLVQSFTGDGWDKREANADSSGDAVLASDRSVASIEISAEHGATAGTVRITVSGPCVTTDGPDSVEVTELEAR